MRTISQCVNDAASVIVKVGRLPIFTVAEAEAHQEHQVAKVGFGSLSRPGISTRAPSSVDEDHAFTHGASIAE
jgi:hypothetical protein